MDERTAREIVARHATGERFAVGILCHVQGSAPQKAGARLIVGADGQMFGTVGGGCLEMETRRRALLALRNGESIFFDLRLDDDFGWDDGLICGGKTSLFVSPDPGEMVDGLSRALDLQIRGERCCLVTRLTPGEGQAAGATFCITEPHEFGRLLSDGQDFLNLPNRTQVHRTDSATYLIEPVSPRPRLYVCGCGHIGAVLIQFAGSVGFEVVAIDDRVDYADVQRLPGADQVHCLDMVTAAATLPTNYDTYWVVVTRGHRNDGKVLAAMINRPHAYVGMIGSRRKVRIIKEGLIGEQIATAEQLGKLHAPIGLDIGGESPQEIALSIAAELVAVRRGKSE